MTLLRNLDTVWELKKMRLIFDTEGNISIIAAQCYSYRKDNDQTANHFGQRPLISPFDISINGRNGRTHILRFGTALVWNFALLSSFQ